MSKTIYIILGIVVIIILGVSIYVLRSPEIGPPIVGQKTYQSKIYGYEVKYPKEWQAKEATGTFQLTGTLGTINVNVTERNKQSIPEWIKKNITFYNKIKEVEVDNCRATIVEDTSDSSSKIVAVFPHGDYVNKDNIVSIAYIPAQKESLIPVVYAQSLEERVEELERILTDFKFTENKGITITSPTQGQIWTEGETYEIRWKPNNPREKVGIQLYDTDFLYADNPVSRSASLAKVWTETVQDTGKYFFTVPVGILTEQRAQTGGVFQIYIGKEGSYGYSPLITVTPAEREFGKPMIEEITGPTQVPAGEQATWFIRARDPQGGVLSEYTASWGDGSPCTLVSCGPKDKSDFSHIFTNPGVYKVKFGVSNSQGLRGFKSIEITVIGEEEADEEVSD